MIKLSFFNLFRRKTRTFLSILGIAVGVAAIIVLVSLVDGFSQDFNDIIGGFKAINIMEKDSLDQTLSTLDSSWVGKIESTQGVRAAVPEIWVLPEKIDGKPIELSLSSAVSLYGLDLDSFYAAGGSGWIGEIEKGARLRNSDRGEVMIGKGVEDNFDKFVGSNIKINDKKFRVKGIFKTESDLVSGIIVLTLDDAHELSNLDAGKISSLTVILNDPTNDKRVGDILKLKYGDDLDVFTQADLSSEISGITDNLRLLAIAVALISALVAGIGIANTILMSVLERFKEIGALKAVGWTRQNIIRMILYESLFLGVIGGIMGIILGFSVDYTLSLFLGVKYFISPALMIESFSFALFLGLIAGLYPAYHASKLDPVEALRG